MADSTLVSVVIVAEAFADAIEATLRSVRMQSHEHWEALVVHPRGAEGSRRAVAEASREDSRIRLIEDAGAGSAQAARNTAVDAADGDWIAFLEPFDTLLPHSLEARLDVAKSRDVLVVHSEGCLLRSDGPHLYGVPPLAGWVYRELLEREGPPFSALLVHRDAMSSVGPADERLAAFHAWDLAIRLARTHRFGFEPTPSFRRDAEAVMAHSHATEATGYEQLLRKHLMPMLRHAGPAALARHYSAAADAYEREGGRPAAFRCRALALAWTSLDRTARLTRVRSLESTRSRPDPERFKRQSSVNPTDIGAQLSALLKEDLTVRGAEFVDGQSGGVFFVRFSDSSAARRLVVLKKVESDFEYRFYCEVLQPFHLSSPKMYGHIRTEEDLFLVMEHIPDDAALRQDAGRFLRAVNWLVAKDRTVLDNLDAIKKIPLLQFDPDRPAFISCVDDSLATIRTAVECNISPLVSPAFLRCLLAKMPVVHQWAADIFRDGRLTVCHRDFHLRNVLFVSGKPVDVYVVDWSNPEIGSVCIDLARLVHTAPLAIRLDLIAAYRSHLEFDGFEEIYAKAETLVGLAEFSWLFSVIIHGRREAMPASKLQAARRLQNQLISALRLGMD